MVAVAGVAIGRGLAASKARWRSMAGGVVSSGSKPWARMFSSAARVHSMAAGRMNFGTKVAIATPPLAGSWASTSSGMLRGWSQTVRDEECEKTTGASVTRRASRMVSAETCERSTSMPSRFISRTTSSPKRVSPPATGSSVAESAHGTLSLWVSVR